MSLTVFGAALLGAVPGILASIVSVYLSRGMNKSIERLKSDLERDSVKFSKWQDKRVEASVAVYVAFRRYLDFLRQALYLKHDGVDVTPMHDFRNSVEDNIVYLEDGLAEKVLRYQGELLLFWNSSVLQVGTDEVRRKLDHEIPTYLMRLRGDINESMDPHYTRSTSHYGAVLHPPAPHASSYPSQT